MSEVWEAMTQSSLPKFYLRVSQHDSVSSEARTGERGGFQLQS